MPDLSRELGLFEHMYDKWPETSALHAAAAALVVERLATPMPAAAEGRPAFSM